MGGSSDDESSDSSEEYLIDPSKINLNSSFFSEKTNTSNARLKAESENSESSDSNLTDVDQSSNVELFSKVLQNLESSNNVNVEDKNSENAERTAKPVEAKNAQPDLNCTISNEINELLLKGETSTNALEDSDEKEEKNAPPTEYTIPKDGIKITLSGSDIVLNKKKKGAPDIKAILRKRIRASQLLVEKVSLLCWLAYGFHLNQQANDAEVMSISLSLMSQSNYPKSRIDIPYLSMFTKWFRSIFVIEIKDTFGKLDRDTLIKRLMEKKIWDYRELVLLYIATLRALGVKCRLIVSLCPPIKKMPEELLSKTETKTQKAKSETAKSKSKTSGKSRSVNKNTENTKDINEKTLIAENSAEAKKNANLEAKKRAAEILRTQPKANKRSRIKVNDNSVEVTTSKTVEEESRAPSLRQLRSRTVNINNATKDSQKVTEGGSKVDGTRSKYYKEESSDSASEKEFTTKAVKRYPKHKSNDSQKVTDSGPKVDGKRSKYYKEENSDSDSGKEFMAKPIKQQSKSKFNELNKSVPSTSKVVKKNRKLLSSDEEEEEADSTRKTEDIWVEVYLESEESWICVSVMDQKFHCVEDVYRKARKPVLYIVAWNSEGLIKDVTRRYCKHWLTVTRKKRIDEKWWTDTLSPWKERSIAISRAEDEMLLQKELEQPLPKTVGECKGHPLYVLQRHLLKFEALYPPNCVPLGHLGTGEAIYSRHCVHTLCSRETWLKKARVVKPKQDPYKIVKARPKYDKLSGMKLKDTALELFGEWQTTEYEPPVAKDGIVPRNEYGNVDLFKECMLPKGTVQINLPGLNRIARKLNIDCAPAVVGFNFGCMGAVPDFGGFVVCEEYEDTLREAWEAEQIEAAKRAKEKREKRVYGNWKRLIQGLIIRERLAAKYEFTVEKKPTLSNKRTKQKTGDAKKSKTS